jgi:hypothetical protein
MCTGKPSKVHALFLVKSTGLAHPISKKGKATTVNCTDTLPLVTDLSSPFLSQFWVQATYS